MQVRLINYAKHINLNVGRNCFQNCPEIVKESKDPYILPIICYIMCKPGHETFEQGIIMTRCFHFHNQLVPTMN